MDSNLQFFLDRLLPIITQLPAGKRAELLNFARQLMEETFREIEEEDEESDISEESYDELLGRLLDERMEEARANPESLISGEELIRRINKKFGWENEEV